MIRSDIHQVNSNLRVSFKVPRPAAKRLWNLARGGDLRLKDVGVLKVQIRELRDVNLVEKPRFNRLPDYRHEKQNQKEPMDLLYDNYISNSNQHDDVDNQLRDVLGDVSRDLLGYSGYTDLHSSPHYSFYNSPKNQKQTLRERNDFIRQRNDARQQSIQTDKHDEYRTKIIGISRGVSTDESIPIDKVSRKITPAWLVESSLCISFRKHGRCEVACQTGSDKVLYRPRPGSHRYDQPTHKASVSRSDFISNNEAGISRHELYSVGTGIPPNGILPDTTANPRSELLSESNGRYKVYKDNSTNKKRSTGNDEVTKHAKEHSNTQCSSESIRILESLANALENANEKVGMGISGEYPVTETPVFSERLLAREAELSKMPGYGQDLTKKNKSVIIKENRIRSPHSSKAKFLSTHCSQEDFGAQHGYGFDSYSRQGVTSQDVPSYSINVASAPGHKTDHVTQTFGTGTLRDYLERGTKREDYQVGRKKNTTESKEQQRGWTPGSGSPSLGSISRKKSTSVLTFGEDSLLPGVPEGSKLIVAKSKSRNINSVDIEYNGGPLPISVSLDGDCLKDIAARGKDGTERRTKRESHTRALEVIRQFESIESNDEDDVTEYKNKRKRGRPPKLVENSLDVFMPDLPRKKRGRPPKYKVSDVETAFSFNESFTEREAEVKQNNSEMMETVNEPFVPFHTLDASSNNELACKLVDVMKDTEMRNKETHISNDKYFTTKLVSNDSIKSIPEVSQEGRIVEDNAKEGYILIETRKDTKHFHHSYDEEIFPPNEVIFAVKEKALLEENDEKAIGTKLEKKPDGIGETEGYQSLGKAVKDTGDKSLPTVDNVLHKELQVKENYVEKLNHSEQEIKVRSRSYRWYQKDVLHRDIEKAYENMFSSVSCETEQLMPEEIYYGENYPIVFADDEHVGMKFVDMSTAFKIAMKESTTKKVKSIEKTVDKPTDILSVDVSCKEEIKVPDNMVVKIMRVDHQDGVKIEEKMPVKNQNVRCHVTSKNGKETHTRTRSTDLKEDDNVIGETNTDSNGDGKNGGKPSHGMSLRPRRGFNLGEDYLSSDSLEEDFVETETASLYESESSDSEPLIKKLKKSEKSEKYVQMKQVYIQQTGDISSYKSLNSFVDETARKTAEQIKIAATDTITGMADEYFDRGHVGKNLNVSQVCTIISKEANVDDQSHKNILTEHPKRNDSEFSDDRGEIAIAINTHLSHDLGNKLLQTPGFTEETLRDNQLLGKGGQDHETRHPERFFMGNYPRRLHGSGLSCVSAKDMTSSGDKRKVPIIYMSKFQKFHKKDILETGTQDLNEDSITEELKIVKYDQMQKTFERTGRVQKKLKEGFEVRSGKEGWISPERENKNILKDTNDEKHQSIHRKSGLPPAEATTGEKVTKKNEKSSTEFHSLSTGRFEPHIQMDFEPGDTKTISTEEGLKLLKDNSYVSVKKDENFLKTSEELKGSTGVTKTSAENLDVKGKDENKSNSNTAELSNFEKTVKDENINSREKIDTSNSSKQVEQTRTKTKETQLLMTTGNDSASKISMFKLTEESANDKRNDDTVSPSKCLSDPEGIKKQVHNDKSLLDKTFTCKEKNTDDNSKTQELKRSFMSKTQDNVTQKDNKGSKITNLIKRSIRVISETLIRTRESKNITEAKETNREEHELSVEKDKISNRKGNMNDQIKMFTSQSQLSAKQERTDKAKIKDGEKAIVKVKRALLGKDEKEFGKEQTRIVAPKALVSGKQNRKDDAKVVEEEKEIEKVKKVLIVKDKIGKDQTKMAIPKSLSSLKHDRKVEAKVIEGEKKIDKIERVLIIKDKKEIEKDQTEMTTPKTVPSTIQDRKVEAKVIEGEKEIVKIDRVFLEKDKKEIGKDQTEMTTPKTVPSTIQDRKVEPKVIEGEKEIVKIDRVFLEKDKKEIGKDQTEMTTPKTVPSTIQDRKVEAKVIEGEKEIDKIERVLVEKDKKEIGKDQTEMATPKILPPMKQDRKNEAQVVEGEKEIGKVDRVSVEKNEKEIGKEQAKNKIVTPNMLVIDGEKEINKVEKLPVLRHNKTEVKGNVLTGMKEIVNLLPANDNSLKHEGLVSKKINVDHEYCSAFSKLSSDSAIDLCPPKGSKGIESKPLQSIHCVVEENTNVSKRVLVASHTLKADCSDAKSMLKTTENSAVVDDITKGVKRFSVLDFNTKTSQIQSVISILKSDAINKDLLIETEIGIGTTKNPAVNLPLSVSASASKKDCNVMSIQTPTNCQDTSQESILETSPNSNQRAPSQRQVEEMNAAQSLLGLFDTNQHSTDEEKCIEKSSIIGMLPNMKEECMLNDEICDKSSFVNEKNEEKSEDSKMKSMETKKQGITQKDYLNLKEETFERKNSNICRKADNVPEDIENDRRDESKYSNTAGNIKRIEIQLVNFGKDIETKKISERKEHTETKQGERKEREINLEKEDQDMKISLEKQELKQQKSKRIEHLIMNYKIIEKNREDVKEKDILTASGNERRDLRQVVDHGVRKVSRWDMKEKREKFSATKEQGPQIGPKTVTVKERGEVKDILSKTVALKENNATLEIKTSNENSKDGTVSRSQLKLKSESNYVASTTFVSGKESDSSIVDVSFLKLKQHSKDCKQQFGESLSVDENKEERIEGNIFENIGFAGYSKNLEENSRKRNNEEDFESDCSVLKELKDSIKPLRDSIKPPAKSVVTKESESHTKYLHKEEQNAVEMDLAAKPKCHNVLHNVDSSENIDSPRSPKRRKIESAVNAIKMKLSGLEKGNAISVPSELSDLNVKLKNPLTVSDRRKIKAGPSLTVKDVKSENMLAADLKESYRIKLESSSNLKEHDVKNSTKEITQIVDVCTDSKSVEALDEDKRKTQESIEQKIEKDEKLNPVSIKNCEEILNKEIEKTMQQQRNSNQSEHRVLSSFQESNSAFGDTATTTTTIKDDVFDDVITSNKRAEEQCGEHRQEQLKKRHDGKKRRSADLDMIEESQQLAFTRSRRRNSGSSAKRLRSLKN